MSENRHYSSASKGPRLTSINSHNYKSRNYIKDTVVFASVLVSKREKWTLLSANRPNKPNLDGDVSDRNRS
jgi:hypothetical protein